MELWAVISLCLFLVKAANTQDSFTISCKINEQVDECHNPCPPRTCSAIGKVYRCPPIDQEDCQPRCDCKFNYRRNQNRTCIPIEQCPPIKCNGENEMYMPCPPQCVFQKCFYLYTFDAKKCKRFNQECQPKCVCRAGYFRDDFGTCIPRSQCRCGKNQTFTLCKAACDNTCIDPKNSEKCQSCVTGCICIDGYVRDAFRRCILLANCPKPVNNLNASNTTSVVNTKPNAPLKNNK